MVDLFKTGGTSPPDCSRVATQDTTPGREWMDLKAVTHYVSASNRTIREWLHRSVNPLPAVRVGRKILVRKSTLDMWLASQALTPLDSVDVDATVSEILSDIKAQRQ